MVQIYGIFLHLFLGWICPGMNALQVWRRGEEAGWFWRRPDRKPSHATVPLKAFVFSRLDLPGYECFAGLEDGRDGGRVVLAEAGQDCRRGLRVDTLGMLLTKRSKFIPKGGRMSLDVNKKSSL
jgi:hypothetical protein